MTIRFDHEAVKSCFEALSGLSFRVPAIAEVLTRSGRHLAFEWDSFISDQEAKILETERDLRLGRYPPEPMSLRLPAEDGKPIPKQGEPSRPLTENERALLTERLQYMRNWLIYLRHLAERAREPVQRQSLHLLVGSGRGPIFRNRSVGRGRTAAIDFSIHEFLVMAVLWRLGLEPSRSFGLKHRREIARALPPPAVERAARGEPLTLAFDDSGPRVLTPTDLGGEGGKFMTAFSLGLWPLFALVLEQADEYVRAEQAAGPEEK